MDGSCERLTIDIESAVYWPGSVGYEISGEKHVEELGETEIFDPGGPCGGRMHGRFILCRGPDAVGERGTGGIGAGRRQIGAVESIALGERRAVGGDAIRGEVRAVEPIALGEHGPIGADAICRDRPRRGDEHFAGGRGAYRPNGDACATRRAEHL